VIPNSDSGIQNESINNYPIERILLGLLIREAYRYPLWYILLKTLCNLAGEGRYFDPIHYWQYLIYLFVILLERVIISVMMLNKLKQVESIWSKKDIQKMRFYNNQYIWKPVQVFDLRIGDIVKLKEGSISPADLLVLDTSQHRHSEKIIYTNESKISGKSRIKVKIAVKVVKDALHREKGAALDQEKLEELMKSMNGYIEYDPPCANLYRAKGVVKFKNDPKANVFTNNNVMFFGSKLHSEWAIGMVIYNGKNVQILKKNFKIGEIDSMRVKGGHFFNKMLNNLTLWMIGVAVVMASLLILMLYMDSISLSTVVLVESVTFGTLGSPGFNPVRKFISILIITLLDMPYYLTLAVDISNIVAIVLMMRKKSYGDPHHAARTTPESPGIHFGSIFRSLRQRIGTIFTSSSAKSSSQTNANEISLVPLHRNIEKRLEKALETDGEHLLDSKNNKATFKEDSGSHGSTSIQEKFSMRSVSNYSVSPPPKMPSKEKKPGHLKDLTVQSHNLDAMSVLGDVGEIIFGKADILTFGTFKLKQLATRAKNYTFDNSDFKTDMVNFRSNPELYNQDDSLDDDYFDEDENYSEKLQEFQSELDCEYNDKLMDSDDDPAEAMKKLSYPRYLSESRTNLLFEVGDEIPSAVKHPDSAAKLGNSKMEDLNSFYQLLKMSQEKKGPKVNFSSRVIDKPNKAREIAEIFHRVIEKSGNISPKNGPSLKPALEQNLSTVLASQKLLSSKNISSNSRVLSKHEEDIVSTKSLEDLMKQDAYQEENEVIKVNFSKEYGVKNFISDLANKKHHLDDFINYLYLFQQCSSLSKNKKHRNFNSTLELKDSLSEIFEEFGYRFRSSGKKKSSDIAAMIEQEIKPQNFFYNIKIDSRYGVVSNYLVKLVNEYTNGRKRMSLIVCDKEKNIDLHYLLVQGEEKNMRSCLRLSKKNKNQYKMLIGKYKAMGNRPLVIGIKLLEKEEVEEYINSFFSLLKISRDQMQNLEKLAISIETNLSFFGMIGVIDEIRPEAHSFCESVKKAGIGMHLFSGDSLERCLYIVKNLKFSESDFSRSGEFFHLNFRTEARGNAEIKRIFEIIYTTLKRADISEKLLVKLKSQKSKTESYRKKIVNWIRHMHSATAEDSVENNLDTADVVPKKTLLISGQSIDVIMNSKHLTNCMLAISLMSNCLILHSAQPRHFIFLADVLKKKNGSAVLAIGDSFNYFGVLKMADVSIQIHHSDVPLIFGDFLVKGLKTAHHLLFYSAFHSFKANLTIVFIEVWRTLPYVFLIVGYLQCSHYSGSLTTSFHLITFYLSASFQVLTSCLIDAPYKKELAPFMPNFYVENKFSAHFTTRIFVMIVICSIIEASYLSVILWYYVSNSLGAEGYVISSVTTVQDFAFLGVMIIGTCKNCFMALRRVYLTACINFVNLAVCLTLYYIYANRRSVQIIDSGPALRILANTNMLMYMAWFCIVPAYFSFCLSLFLKAKLLAPYSKPLSNSHGFKDVYKNFIKEIDVIRERLMATIQDRSIDAYISKIKSFFGRGIDFAALEKIAFIDTFTNRSGITYLTNRIQEKGDAKRFRMVQIRMERLISRRMMGIVIFVLVGQWIFLMTIGGAPKFGMDTYLPHTIAVAFVPFTALFVKRHYDTVYSILSWSAITIVLLTVAFTFDPQISAWGNSKFAVSRLLFSSYPLDYVTTLLFGTICDTFSFVE
jgi:magnesium-transporting ATPase (P-type)